MARQKRPLKTIGRMEIVDFPELELFDIESKVDTGAYTSSIHCENIRIRKEGSRELLCFQAFTHGNDERSLKDCCYDNFRKKLVRNSFGNEEERYVIHTHIIMFGRPYALDISLADRQKMRFPVLLGRSLLYRKFLVDVSRKNLNRKEERGGGKGKKS